MKTLLALFRARNIEYYRDIGSLSWSFIFPLLIIIGCAVAFSNPDTRVFKVGIYAAPDIEADINQPFIKTIPLSSLPKGLERLKYHQLDLLISEAQGDQYWINRESNLSLAAEQWFLGIADTYQREETSGQAVRYVDWVIPGVLGMNLMFGALYGVGYVIVRYRRNGVLKRLQVTPVTPLSFLTAQLLSRLMIVVAVNAIIFTGCLWTLDLIVLGSYWDLFIVTILGSLAMIAIGLLVACRTDNEELANGILNIATWPMLFLSEIWFSLEDSPDWLQSCADFLPLTHIVKATRAIMIDGAPLAAVSHHLIWLIAICSICLMLAASLFRWSSIK